LNFLVLGSSGFIGSYLFDNLQKVYGHSTNGISQNPSANSRNTYYVSNLFDDDSTYNAINTINKKNPIDCVIYCSGIAHQIHSHFCEKKLFSINVDLVLKISGLCNRINIKNFIFISSIGVLGDLTSESYPFNNYSRHNPSNIYNHSKCLAENKLLKKINDYNYNIIIIRPPIVYGKNAKGNFSTLLDLLKTKFPLPFGSFHNYRSMINIENLCDFIEHIARTNSSKQMVLNISDGLDLTYSEFFNCLSSAIHGSSKVFKFPLPLLKFLFFIVGKKSYYYKLSNPLIIDISQTLKLTGWSPKISPQAFLKKHYK